MRGMIGESEITTKLVQMIEDLQLHPDYYYDILEAVDVVLRYYIENIECDTPEEESRSLRMIKGVMQARKALETIHHPEDMDLEENRKLDFAINAPAELPGPAEVELTID